MAKKSKIAKNEQRKEIVARFAERRNELKAIIKNPNTSDEDRLEAQFELNRQPRDASNSVRAMKQIAQRKTLCYKPFNAVPLIWCPKIRYRLCRCQVMT